MQEHIPPRQAVVNNFAAARDHARQREEQKGPSAASPSITVSDLNAALDKQKAELEKLVEDNAQAHSKALKQAKAKTSAPVQKKKEKKGKNSNGKNSNGNKEFK